MIFGVHNHYNNNADGIGDFIHPVSGRAFNEASVRVSDQGIVVFNLDRKINLASKIELATAINSALKERFGTGISFATSAASDCTKERELKSFFARMEEIVPDVTTIYTTTNHNGRWLVPSDLKVDHMLDQRTGTMPEQIANIVQPSDNDKTEPAGGWERFETVLQDIYDKAHQSVLSPKPDLPTAPTLRHQP